LENQEANWLARALERNGFVVKETNRIPENGFFACYENGSFRLYRDAKPVAVALNIADILETLKGISGG